MEEVKLVMDLIFRHVPGWSPLWERLSHIPGDGHCGTMKLESIIRVVAVLRLILKMGGIPEYLVSLIEAGCGVLDFAKGLFIGLPRANFFCYELKNYYDNVFSDLTQLGNAMDNLKDMMSVKYGINIKNIGIFEYVFGVKMDPEESVHG